MANSLNIDLTGLAVIFRQECLTLPNTDHPFRVDSGFGALPSTHGRTIGGMFLSDGEVAERPLGVSVRARPGFDVSWRLPQLRRRGRTTSGSEAHTP